MAAPAELKSDRHYHDALDNNTVNGNGHNGSALGDYGAYQGSGGAVHRAVSPGGHPVDSSQPAFPVYHRKFANPAPLGLLG